MNKSIILDSEYIQRDIEGIAVLIEHIGSSLLESGYIDERDYYALQLVSKTLSEDIAKRIQELIEASYKLLKEKK
jgi:hypothetical protein